MTKSKREAPPPVPPPVPSPTKPTQPGSEDSDDYVLKDWAIISKFFPKNNGATEQPERVSPPALDECLAEESSAEAAPSLPRKSSAAAALSSTVVNSAPFDSACYKTALETVSSPEMGFRSSVSPSETPPVPALPSREGTGALNKARLNGSAWTAHGAEASKGVAPSASDANVPSSNSSTVLSFHGTNVPSKDGARQKLIIPPVIITDVSGHSRQSSFKNSLRLLAHVRVSMW